MKRQIIIILSLVVLVAITFGAYLFVRSSNERKQQKEADEAAALQLVDFNSSDITGIELKTPDGDYAATLDDSGSWEMTEDTDFNINIYYLNSIAGSLCNLSAAENIGEATEDIKKQYELDDPYVVTLSTADETRTIYTGKLTATSEYYYVMTDSSDDIFLVDADYGDYLCPNKNSLKSIYVQTNQSDPITHINLVRNGETIYDLQLQDDSTWLMTDPIESDYVNVANITSLQTDILQLIIDKFGEEDVTEADYATYGFDDPAYTFTFDQEDGSTTTIYALDYDVNSTNFVECLQKETGQIFYCAANYISLLQANTEDYLSDTVCDIDVADVTALSLQMDGEEMEMEIDEANGQYSINDIDIDELGSDAISALELFYESITSLTSDTLYITEVIPKTAAEVAVTYTLTDGSTETLELIPKDDNTYYAIRNGEYTGFLVNKSQFTTRTGVLEMYNRLKKAIGLSD